jgi:hypothetical protein
VELSSQWRVEDEVQTETFMENSDSYPRRVFTTGPLSIDPERQKFVGVLMENDTYHPAKFIVRLFNKDHCPKKLKTEICITIPPRCSIGIAFHVPGFFYEAQISQISSWGLLTAVYGLTCDFVPIAANTLHPMDLIMIHE